MYLRACSSALCLALLLGCGGADSPPLSPDGGGGGDGGPSVTEVGVVAHAGSDLMVPVGAQVRLDASASFSLAGRRLGYLWTQASGPPVTLSDPGARVARFRAPASPDDILLRLTVSDGQQEASDFVLIRVREGPGDTAPLAIAGPDLEVAPGQVFVLDASGSHDLEGDGLALRWTHAGAPDDVLSTEARLELEAPQVDAELRLVFRLEAGDGLLEAPDDVVVRVRPALRGNLAPTASSSERVSVAAGETVELSGEPSDPEGDPVRLTWRQVFGPPVDLELDVRRARFVAPLQVARLGFVLLATDEDLASAPLPIVVDVTAGANNRAPVADAGADQEVAVGSEVGLDGSGSSDPDGDALAAWTWNQLGGPPVVLVGADGPSPTFLAPESPAVLTFALTVDDGQVCSAQDTVQVTAR